ncbi:MAG: glycosyltransferase family 4 protein [Sphingomonadaceae bacterium]
MKILIPALGFDRSGGYRVLARLASEWIRLGAQAQFLVPAGSGAPYFPTSAEILESDPLGRITSGGGEVRPPARFEGARRLLCLVAGLRGIANGHDVILANHSLTAWPAMVARGKAIRRFYYIQADEAEYFRMERQHVKRLLAEASYRLPLYQISNSPTYADRGAIRAIATIPPGVDFSDFHPKPVPRDFSDGQPVVIGCIGRREPSKGISYALAAFRSLHAYDPRFRLRVAYGNLPEPFDHSAMEIVHPGNDRELADFYRNIDILVAPGTVQHGAPHYPVMEAMACATPVVTTGYMPANPENSWIVANRSPDAIVEAVMSLVQDKCYRERVARALEAIASFEWSAVASRMLDLFLDRGR